MVLMDKKKKKVGEEDKAGEKESKGERTTGWDPISFMRPKRASVSQPDRNISLCIFLLGIIPCNMNGTTNCFFFYFV